MEWSNSIDACQRCQRADQSFYSVCYLFTQLKCFIIVAQFICNLLFSFVCRHRMCERHEHLSFVHFIYLHNNHSPTEKENVCFRPILICYYSEVLMLIDVDHHQLILR